MPTLCSKRRSGGADVRVMGMAHAEPLLLLRAAYCLLAGLALFACIIQVQEATEAIQTATDAAAASLGAATGVVAGVVGAAQNVTLAAAQGGAQVGGGWDSGRGARCAPVGSAAIGVAGV